MKFRFRKVGPIREAEVELGDLTILAGRNNTGKTYLAYTLYGFLKRRPGWPDAHRVLLGDDSSGAEGTNAAMQRALRTMAAALVRDGEARYAVDRETLGRERTRVADALGRSFSEMQLAAVFSSPPSEFKDARLEVKFDDPFPESVPPRRISLGPGLSIECEYNGREIVARRIGPGDQRSPALETPLSILYFHLLMAGLPDPFILSSERFGISLFYKELDFRKNQLVDVLQKLRDDKTGHRLSPYLLIDKTTSRYALPIKDNIDYTRGISDLKNQRSEIHEARLFNDIKDMMDGYYSAADDEIRFISKRRKDSRFNIALHRASSSARGLSDFYFFLRHVASRNHLLIVDEPEGHLDTANQVELARLLSRIVRAGVRVLVTTHSDYFVKEINNLLMLNHLQPDEELRRELGYEGEVSLDATRVLAYVAEDGGVRRCALDKYGIGMPNFETTIAEINRRSYELAGRLLTDDPSEAS